MAISKRIPKRPKDKTKSKHKVDKDGYLIEPDEEEPANIWLPGMPLDEGEHLEADPQAYKMLHTLNTEWPCLSFDILSDPWGSDRHSFPLQCLLAAGTYNTQKPDDNKIILIHCHDLQRTGGFNSDDEDEEGSEPSSEEEEEEEGDEEDNENGMDIDQEKKSKMITPKHEFVEIPHESSVNRIRVSPLFDASFITENSLHSIKPLIATFSDRNKVHIYQGNTLLYTTPKKIHRCEGFGLSWNSLGTQLLSGDNQGVVNLFSVRESAIELISTLTANPFVNQKRSTPSIEDINWSPAYPDHIFATACNDGTLRLWDLRTPSSSHLVRRLFDCDLNVLSWNKQDFNMLAVGAESGAFATIDLRQFNDSNDTNKGNSFIFQNDSWHRSAITSIEWHPTDSTVLAVAGDDDQISFWDLEVEPEDPIRDNLQNSNVKALKRVPPQLMFIHAGQQEVREIHWHSQIPGLLISTSLTGFNLIKTISI